jgi:hypothetical protein
MPESVMNLIEVDDRTSTPRQVVLKCMCVAGIRRVSIPSFRSTVTVVVLRRCEYVSATSSPESTIRNELSNCPGASWTWEDDGAAEAAVASASARVPVRRQSEIKAAPLVALEHTMPTLR